MGIHDNRIRILQRTAKEIISYRTQKKILLAALSLLVSFTLILYSMSAIYTRTGSFTINVDRQEMMEFGLSLKEQRDQSFETTELNAKPIDKITNINGTTIPDTVCDKDGSNNGENYLAYTFYLINGGEAPLSCEYTVEMSNATNGIEEAVRLRLYINNERQGYAFAMEDKDGNPEEEYGYVTTPFESEYIMTTGRISDLKPGDSVKFTIVFWIEGNDDECTDSIVDGKLKIDMNFEVKA